MSKDSLRCNSSYSASASTAESILEQVITRTDRPFAEELPSLLAERALSQRRLAQMVDLNPSHLSRVLRGADGTRPSTDLVNRVAEALDLPVGYFPESREAEVIERVNTDPELRDDVYDRLVSEALARTRGRRTKG